MKIAIISTSQGDEVADLITKARDFGVECESVRIEDVNLKPTDVDVVYWRSAPVTPQFKKTLGRSLVMHTLSARAKIVNHALMDNPLITSKSYQQAVVLNATTNIQGIETYLAKDRDALMHLIGEGLLKYPFIAKPDQGSQGKGVELITTPEEINVLGKISSYSLQNFIPNTCDYRVFVVGGVAIDVVRRQFTSTSTKEYLNNLSQGGRAEKVTDPVLYAKLARKGESLAALFDLTVCGVDLIQNSETGQIHFMEINTAPQWLIFGDALSVDVSKKILETLITLASRKKTLSICAVREHYERNLTHLQPQKRFHFLSRMYLWTRDDKYKVQLEALRLGWLPDTKRLITLAKKIPTLSPLEKSGGRSYRREGYKKHFKIYSYNRIFFKALFLKTIYNEPIDTIIGAIDVLDVRTVRDELLADTESVFALSTHAVNFLYHYEHFFGERIEPEYILEVGNICSLSDNAHDLEARAYLFTHAIIGASHFYATRRIPEHIEVYTEMLQNIEGLIQNHFTQLSLDVKCEFLVCAKLLGYESPLRKSIWSEVEASSSAHGDFIVDTFNQKRTLVFKKNFHASEHRNVLAILAFDEITK